MRAREIYLALYRGRLTISNVNLREKPQNKANFNQNPK